MTDDEKDEFRSKMAAAKAAKAAKPPETPPGTTTAATARRPQKTGREIDLEKANAVLEDRLTELERFVKSLGGHSRAPAPSGPAPAPAAGTPAPASKWDWEGFAEHPL